VQREDWSPWDELLKTMPWQEAEVHEVSSMLHTRPLLTEVWCES
jgi:hypothetical protein